MSSPAPSQLDRALAGGLFNWICLQGYRQGNALRDALEEYGPTVRLRIVESSDLRQSGSWREHEQNLLAQVRQQRLGSPVLRVFSMNAFAAESERSSAVFFAATENRIAAMHARVAEPGDTAMKIDVFGRDEQDRFVNIGTSMGLAYGDGHPHFSELRDFVRSNLTSFAQQALQLAREWVSLSSDESPAVPAQPKLAQQLPLV